MMTESEKIPREISAQETAETYAQRKERLRMEIPELESKLDRVKLKLKLLRTELKNEELSDKESEHLITEIGELSQERHTLSDAIDQKKREEEELIAVMEHDRTFDKYIIFRNIRELLKVRDVKLGQIERDAGLTPGYMSRLEKPGNSTDPTLEFVITAAKDLNVSVDYLLYCDITSMSSTDLYKFRFIDKLKKDTIKGKLLWMPEQVSYRDNGDTKVMHPLLVLNKEFKNSSLVRKYIFNSHSFGADTIVDDDCYSVSIGEGTKVYLMNIQKQELDLSDESGSPQFLFRFATEIWMLLPDNTVKYFCSDLDNGEVGEVVGFLNAAVQNYMSQPQIDASIMDAIDIYMNDGESDVADSI